jgi:hypothetical protein
VAEDKVDRLEARTALLPPEPDAQREAAVAEPGAQPEAAVAAAKPDAQQQTVAAVAVPDAQREVAVAVPGAQQQAAVAVVEPVAQQQAVAAAAVQSGVRPLVASVELAETAVVRFWIREASFLVRAPEQPMVPAAKEREELDPRRVACRLSAAAVVR